LQSDFEHAEKDVKPQSLLVCKSPSSPDTRLADDQAIFSRADELPSAAMRVEGQGGEDKDHKHPQTNK
jgi:hypothetical protein